MEAFMGKDEKALRNMLDGSTDFEERRKIRAAIRDVRNKRFRTVTVYETPASAAASGSSIHWQPPSVATATCPPPAEAILQAPVTERVRIVRKAQSFSSAAEVSHVNSTAQPAPSIHNKSDARNFLSKRLSFMAADNVDINGIDSKPIGRSQSFKVLASKFENNSVPISSNVEKFNSDGNQLKSASAVVETDQVVSSVRIGRTHSLKLPTYRDDSPSSRAPIGSLAYSYNEKAKRLMSGSDSDLSRTGQYSFKDKEALIGNRKIRPFLKSNETNSGKEDSSNKPEEISSVEKAVTTKKPSFRSSAPFFSDVKDVRRSSSLRNPAPALFEGQETKVQRAGSLRNSPQTCVEPDLNSFSTQNGSYTAIDRSENLISNDIVKSNVKAHSCQQDNSFESSSSEPSAQEKTVSDSKECSIENSREHSLVDSVVNSSFEEKSAKKRVSRTSVSNPLEDIEDEDALNQMLKNATDLDERINIRAALHKLRQNHLANKNSLPRKTELTKNSYTTKLEQNKAAIQSLMQSTVSTSQHQPVTEPSNQDTSLHNSLHNSSMSSHHSNEDDNDDVFKTFRSSHGKRAQSSSDIPTEYCSIQSEDQLQNLLNQTTDYFERKKIRTALTALKRRHSLAEVEKLKGKHSQKSTKSIHDNHHQINNHHLHDNRSHHDNNNTTLDTEQNNKTVETRIRNIKTTPAKTNEFRQDFVYTSTKNTNDTSSPNGDCSVSVESGSMPTPTGMKSRDTVHQNTNLDIRSAEITKHGIHQQKQNSDDNQHQQEGGCDLVCDNVSKSINVQQQNSFNSHYHHSNSSTLSDLSVNGSGCINSSSKQNRVKRKLPEIPTGSDNHSVKQSSLNNIINSGLSDNQQPDNNMEEVGIVSGADVLNCNVDIQPLKSESSVVLDNEDLGNGNVISIQNSHVSSLSNQQLRKSHDLDKCSLDKSTEWSSPDSSNTVTTTLSLSSGLQSGMSGSVVGNTNNNDPDSGVGSVESQSDKTKISTPSSLEDSGSAGEVDKSKVKTTPEEPETLKSLDDLRDELDDLEKQLSKSSVFDDRKRLRTEIRQIRILIRDGDFILRTPRYVQPADGITLASPQGPEEEKFSDITTDANQNKILPVQSSQGEVKADMKQLETVKADMEIETANVDLIHSSRVESKSYENSESIKSKCDNIDDTLIKKDICDLNNQKARNSSHSREGKKTTSLQQSNLDGKDDAFKILKNKLHSKKPSESKSSEEYVILDIVDNVVVNTKDDKRSLNNDLNKTRRSSQDIYTCEDIGEYVDIAQKEKTEECIVSSGNLPNKAEVVVVNTEEVTSKQSLEDDIPEIISPLADIIAIDGENACLTCKISAPSKADITWYKETRILKDTPEFNQTRDNDVISLIIPEVFPDDEGEYRCVAKANGGEAETSCYLLIKVNSKSLRWRTRLPKASTPRRKRRIRKNKVAVLPSFMTALQDQTVDDGAQVTLKCEVSATKPPPRIYWYHEAEMLKNQPEMRQEFSDGWATLTISEMFTEDGGTYTCAAKNVAGESKCSCKLTVTDKTPSPYTPPPEEEEEESPELTMDTDYHDLTQGDCLTLICRVTGSPTPCIVWKKDNITLSASTTCHIDSTESQASLVIFKVQSLDDGMYECIAKNNAGTASVTSVVTVKAKPKQTKLPVTQNGRSPSKLSRSQPVSKMSDSRNKHRSSSSSSMKEESNKLRNSSTSSYKDSEVFTVTNDKSDTVTNDNKGLKLEKSTQEISNKNIQPVKVSNNNEVQPAKNNHEQSSSLSKDVKKINEPVKNEPVKIVNKIKEPVKNEPVKIEKSKMASAIDPPRILQPLPDHLEIVLEQQFCLECRFNYLSQKTVIAWFKDGIELPKVGRIKWSVEKAYTKLWINRASKGDVGNYRVLIKNGGGEAGSRCQVKVKSIVAPGRAKLEPKQVDQKASNLLNSVLGHMITNKQQQENRNQHYRHDDHTKHLVNLIKPHREHKETGNHKYIVHLDSDYASTQNEEDDKPQGLETLHEDKELKMSKNIADIDDEDLLYNMMSQTDNFDERKKIRGRLREIRESKADDYDKRRQERESNREDALQMKIRQAEADKQRKMKEFDKMAKAPKKEMTAMEERIREKHAAADKDKQKKLEDMKEMGKVMSQAYHSGSDQITIETIKKGDEEKARKMAEFKEDASSRSTRTENVPGGTMTTSTSKTTHTSKDGSSVTTTQTKQITQTGSVGGTSYSISKTSAEDAAKRLCDTFSNKALEGTSGILTVKTEAWSSKDGITHRKEKTKTWGAKQGPRSAMSAFKQMDNTNNPNAGRPKSYGSSSSTPPTTPTSPTSPDGPIHYLPLKNIRRNAKEIKEQILRFIQANTAEYELWWKQSQEKSSAEQRGDLSVDTAVVGWIHSMYSMERVGGGRVGIQRSPSAVKDLLLQWIKRQVDGYPNVNVTNFSSSWSDGMAFCALIHHFHPEAFDFSKLDPKRRRANFKLAFDVAEKLADISPLLDVEDMVRMKNPDWKCVFTYVQFYYSKFRNHDANQATAS